MNPSLKQTLLETLGIDLDKGSSILDRQFEIIEECKAEENHQAVKLNLLRLEYFLHNLRVLESDCPIVFEKVKRDFKGAKDTDSFYGFRFETYLGNRLCRHKLKFRNRESPDFEIESDVKVYIECSSLRSRGGRKEEADFEKKLFDKIQEKESKSYAKQDCALMLDLTNILYNIEPTNWQSAIDTHKKITAETMDHERYGSILLFRLTYSQKNDGLQYSSDRVDSSEIKMELRDFLNDIFPHPGVKILGPAVPKEA